VENGDIKNWMFVTIVRGASKSIFNKHTLLSSHVVAHGHNHLDSTTTMTVMVMAGMRRIIGGNYIHLLINSGEHKFAPVIKGKLSCSFNKRANELSLILCPK
jgi:hypothetical protein